MMHYYKIGIVGLFLLLMSNAGLSGSFITSITEAIQHSDYYAVEAAIEKGKNLLSVKEQRFIIEQASRIRQLADHNAWFSSETKKGISSTTFLVMIMASLLLCAEPFSYLLFLIHPEATFRDRRDALVGAAAYKKCLIAAVFLMTTAVLAGYDCITGYYTERERYILNFLYNNLPYFQQQLPPGSKWAY